MTCRRNGFATKCRRWMTPKPCSHRYAGTCGGPRRRLRPSGAPRLACHLSLFCAALTLTPHTHMLSEQHLSNTVSSSTRNSADSTTIYTCRKAGEEGEAAVFKLHEVQLQLDDARASLDALQRQQQYADAANQQQQLQLSPHFSSESGTDAPRPQQLPQRLRQRAAQRVSSPDSTADAEALQAARQQLAAQGRQLAKQVRRRDNARPLMQ